MGRGFSAQRLEEGRLRAVAGPLSTHPLARPSFVTYVVLWPVGRDIFQEPRTNRNFLMTLDLELLG